MKAAGGKLIAVLAGIWLLLIPLAAQEGSTADVITARIVLSSTAAYAEAGHAREAEEFGHHCCASERTAVLAPLRVDGPEASFEQWLSSEAAPSSVRPVPPSEPPRA